MFLFMPPKEGIMFLNCPSVSLSVRPSVCVRQSVTKNFNLAHNFLITEWIHFIFEHNIPWDKSFQLPSSLMTLTPK